MAKYGHTKEQERARALTFLYLYGLPVWVVARLFGVSTRTLCRWWAVFVRTGTVEREARKSEHRWPREVEAFVLELLDGDPGMMAEEMLLQVQQQFPSLRNVSRSTLLRVLHDDMGMSRLKMTRRAYEARTGEVNEYFSELALVYCFPEQLVFVDETSKDARAMYRDYGWAKKGQRAHCRRKFMRGPRRSILAALSVDGFLGYAAIVGTYTRDVFHQAFLHAILPHLNPYPAPNSIVVLDNASIHRYPELEECIRMHGARLVYLPPYSPQLNPIEYAFNCLKMWLRKYVDPLLFCTAPDGCIQLAMEASVGYAQVGLASYAGCGYETRWLGHLVPKRLKARVQVRFPFFVLPRSVTYQPVEI